MRYLFVLFLSVLFAKEQGMPRYDDVYELERPLMGLE